LTETQPEARRADRLYGAVAGVMILLALVFLLRGGPEDGAAPAVPTLRILEPSPRRLIAQPITLVFDAGVALRPSSAGWTADGRHVHVRVAGTELMAGVAQIQPAGGTRYRWVLPALPAGEQTLQLFWSDEAHRPIRAGASSPVRVYLR
jgi:hypothetical protein